MRKIAAPFAVVGLSAALAAAATPLSPRTSFLPPNDMKIPISKLGNKGITRDQYDAVMDRIAALYGPIIAARGGNLVINRLWDDETVNASAERNGKDWIINMYGGLARHPAITQDGMALVACHELGHHLGGAPKYPADWAADEGEADYFANAKCLHRVFADPASEPFTRASAEDEFVKKACAQSFATPSGRAICERSSAAGMSVTQLLRELSSDPEPHFNTPDPSVVTQTYDAHPATQCRLDTYFQGSLCAKSFKIDMDDVDPAVGACVKSQGFTSGLRPRCWYLPPAGESAETRETLPSPHPLPKTLRVLTAPGLFRGL